MNETRKGRKDQGLMIAGLIVLILALMLGVTLIFAGLEAMAGQTVPAGSQSASAGQSREEAVPSFCPFCGEGLHESFQWGQFCPWCGEKVEQ